MAKFKNMDEISYIVIHSTATTADEHLKLEDIDRIHRNQNMLSCGFHAVIRRDGFIEYGRPFNRAGNHIEGHNHESLGVCLVGGKSNTGKPMDNFTDAQFKNLEWLLNNLHESYVHAKVVPHSYFEPNLKCPCFAVKPFLLRAGLAKLNLIK